MIKDKDKDKDGRLVRDREFQRDDRPPGSRVERLWRGAGRYQGGARRDGFMHTPEPSWRPGSAGKVRTPSASTTAGTVHWGPWCCLRHCCGRRSSARCVSRMQEQRLRIAKQRAEKGERPEKQPKARKAMKVTARTSMKGKAHGARGRPGKIAKH